MKKYHYLFRPIRLILPSLILLVFITILLVIFELSGPRFKKLLIDDGVIGKDMNKLILFAIICLVILVGKNLISMLNDIIFSKISAQYIKALKMDYYSRIIRLPAFLFDESQSTYIVSRIEEIDSISSILSQVLLKSVVSLISMIGALAYLFSRDKLIFAFSLLSLPLIYLYYNKSTKNIIKMSAHLFDSQANLKGQLQESLAGIKEIKQYNQENSISQKINLQLQDVMKKGINRSVVLTKGSTGISIITEALKIVLTFIVGVKIMNAQLTIGDYASFLDYVSFVYAPVILLTSYSLSIQPALAAIARMSEFYGKDIEDDHYGDEQIDHIESIEMENVMFSYQKENCILNNVNISLSKGDKVLIMGENGSGKTTLIKLLFGFILPNAGNLYYNKQNINKYDIHTIRNKIGYISQDSYLFSGSIMDNILLEGADSMILDELIRNEIFKGVDWKNGYVLENGKNLSSGQRQKVALARILLKNPDVIIIDEGVTNLDSETKKLFNDVIQNLFHDKICLMITHSDDFTNVINKKYIIHEKLLVQS